MSRLVDDDGTPLVRDRAGDLVPDPDHPTTTDQPDTECPDHLAQPASRCGGCWAEIKAGDRPRSFLGRHHHNH